MADGDPDLLEDPLHFVVEDLLVRIDTAIDPFALSEGRFRKPLLMIFCGHRVLLVDLVLPSMTTGSWRMAAAKRMARRYSGRLARSDAFEKSEILIWK